MFSKQLIVMMLIALACAGVHGQAANPFSLSITPGADMPLGPVSPEGHKLYTLGGSVDLAAEYTLPFAPIMFAEGLFGFSVVSTSAQTSLTLISLGIGPGVRLSPLQKLEVKLFGAGGYSIGLYQGNVGGAPFLKGGGTVTYALSRSVRLGLGATYDHHFSLYNGISAFVGVNVRLGSEDGRSRVDPVDIRLDPIYPVFYQYYDDNPLGSAIIRNNEKGTVRDVKVSFFVNQFMEKPKLCAQIPEMKKDEEQRIPLFALFTDNILEITEGSKVTGEIIIEYDYLDSVVSGGTGETIQIYHRNAMTWEDDRRAASFVTAKDPEVLRFSKSIAGAMRNEGNQAVDSNFRSALGLFEALRIFGINYVIDPASSYIELSENKYSLDYLQFPVQTLSYRAGDCDDLSILYSALLESIGIETAFITIPGHIYMAFSLEMNPQEARKVFAETDELIIHGDRVYVPVEITMIQEGFLEAWNTGARQWIENNTSGTAQLYPIHEAWNTYAPVGMADPNARIEGVAADQVVRSYNAEMDRFIDLQIGNKVDDLLEKIGQSRDPKLINRLGVLYARFGLYEKAKSEFEAASEAQFTPALINLGNIFFLQNDYRKALDLFNRAGKVIPDNISIEVGIAKANYALEKFDQVEPVYKRIEELSPETASRFSYLVSKSEDIGRASAAVRTEELVWDEGE